ncbi:MAG: hypothetical protein COC17_03830 [Hyphomicrobiales bacterium]|nr:hypothetical protein [Hyphomicrobiales bacterium]PCH50713.1 MAG: hypothetical protein COC17_03830 [Hyphomicrobiales bacterium]
MTANKSGNKKTRFTDAALLKGKYAFHAEQLRVGSSTSAKKVDWTTIECGNQAEETAQEVAKHIFAFNEALDPEKEQLEIISLTAVGQMKVLGLAPGEGDILRVDGVLMPDELPTSVVVHASQLALTFVRVPIKSDEPEKESESNRIGFVIFDDLQDRQKARYKKNKSKAKKVKKSKVPTMDELMKVALKAKKLAKKKSKATKAAKAATKKIAKKSTPKKPIKKKSTKKVKAK